ncbi:MAG: carboxypeptidase-like regulatory domain-containing protein [Bacteroidota bacterium]|nr:carboxypeptidase-like regulatory domain-containing protein [Bacteroidota bacterium]
MPKDRKIFPALFITAAFLFVLLLVSIQLAAQKPTAVISGKLLDEKELPLAKVSIVILGRETGIISSDSGTFRLRVPADKAIALVFSYTGYKTVQRNFLLNDKEEEQVLIRMEKSDRVLPGVIVNDERDRKEAGLIRINPKDAVNIPSPGGSIENLIKVFVGSTNELTSQYSVRGGNYDENLIYVNDFEIFRPYLVSNAQQEGLSFINPDMTRNVSFYNGGFQAKYGDKISSVLDIQYKKPKKFGGSAYAGLLEQGLELEGASGNNRFSYLIGMRNRSYKNLLSAQETKGNYAPSSADIQGLFTYQLNSRNSLELFTVYSQTAFNLIPQSAQLTTAVFSPYFSSNLALDVFFNGQERDLYQTGILGLTWNKQVNRELKLKWMVSLFNDHEREAYDITGDYLFGERDFDKTSADFGTIVNPLGAGVYQNYARNLLNITVLDLSHKGYLNRGNHYIQWGLSAKQETVHDRVLQWQYQDSAGYSLPNQPGSLVLFSSQNGQSDLQIGRLTGFIQDNISFPGQRAFTLQAGARINYNTLNQELLVSPRLGFSWKPKKSNRDVVYRGAVGIYDQPPFYREFRKPDGTINKELKAQKSWQVTGGADFNFHAKDKPFRLSVEAYYKSLWDVNPYNVNNVHIQYFGTNNARAYAMGIEGRLFGNLVKDAESWVSIGLMRTREKIDGAQYYDYTLDSLNRPIDSNLVKQGWIRRPTDRLLTLGMFIQDYLSTNKNFKVYLNLLYGSNLPFSIPESVKYRNALVIDPYIRADIGFSALLLDNDKANRRSHSPFRNLENIWATLEIFNLIDRENTISYLLIKDFSNTTYAMPQRLTPRLINFKLITRF